ncbi:MAG: hypothetical protein PHW74_07910 [Desulfobacca sp.]|nr:hypothetical protein [Desulfobacca sp.]
MGKNTKDLSVEAFLALRNHFFDEKGKPVSFHLRPKSSTQDDPFDELLGKNILAKLNNVQCEKAPGPLITPDLVLFRPVECKNADKAELKNDISRILAIEVKKLERTKQGNVARASGLDYNTTPPCGIVRVYDSVKNTLDIRSFYLFVCLETDKTDISKVILSALALVDGNLLNTDFNLYLKVVGEREKQIGLGSYANGADRTRPMLIFANPLGAELLDYRVTLIHQSPKLENSKLRLVYQIIRTSSDKKKNKFYCYRLDSDVQYDWEVSTLTDPFPTPVRDFRTRPRGRFKLPFRIRDSKIEI